MDEREVEAIVINLVVHGGDAKSYAIEAIKCARLGKFDQADMFLKQSSESLNRAHEFQMERIQQEIIGQDNKPLSLLMVHGQDHLMCALTTRDLAVQIVELCKQVTTGSGE